MLSPTRQGKSTGAMTGSLEPTEPELELAVRKSPPCERKLLQAKKEALEVNLAGAKLDRLVTKPLAPPLGQANTPTAFKRS